MNAPLSQSAILVLLLAVLSSSIAGAQLQVVPDKEPPCVFAGEGRSIAVRFHNPSERPVTADLRTRLYQASSATAIPLGEAPWKKLEVLAGQTVLESATRTFPAVKAETRFLVQWLEGTNRVVGGTEVPVEAPAWTQASAIRPAWVPGTTAVLVYPPDLLKELKPLAGEEPLGVFDPQNQLKPLLKAVAADFQDMEDSGVGDYHGKLAIVGPFQSRAQMPEEVADKITKLAAKGVAVVWIQPPPEKRQELKPTFYTVPEGKGAVVVVQPELVANLPENPQAQLNLVRFARVACHPEPLRLPYLSR